MSGAITPLRILLVDSDGDDASSARQWLDAAGASAHHSADATAAAHLLSLQNWDLVIADIALPGGLDVVKLAKASSRWTSALVLTRSHRIELMQQVLRQRVDGLLVKPVDRDEFVKQTISLAQSARDRRRRECKRVLAVGAHPDDVELGCGGTMLRHRADGDELMILTLSQGAYGGDTEVRVREARRAAVMLGAKLEFGDLKDAHIPEGVKTIAMIDAAIRAFDPTHVYTHSSEDSHQDHRNVHAASVVAARNVANLFCYQSPSSTVAYRPNMFVDISNHIDDKLRLVAVYESQTSRRVNLAADLLVATARYWGRYAGYVLAEPLNVFRQRIV